MLFNLGKATSIGEEKFWIEITCKPDQKTVHELRPQDQTRLQNQRNDVITLFAHTLCFSLSLSIYIYIYKYIYILKKWE